MLARYEEEHEADAVFIDGGYGTGIVSAGRTMGRSWQLVWFSGKSGRLDCFNKRAEIYMNVHDWIKDGGALDEKDQDLYDQMIAVELLPTLDGKFKLPPKADYKEETGLDPGDIDCLAISFAYPVAKKSPVGLQSAQRRQQSGYHPVDDRLKSKTGRPQPPNPADRAKRR